MAGEERSAVGRPKRVVIGLGIMWLLLAAAIMFIQFGLPPKVEIEWETETEINTAGFNIYRSETADGPFVRINDQIIPSQTDAVSGAAYRFVDENVQRGKTYYYRLEDIEYDNTTQQHDVLTGEVDAFNWWTIPLTLVSAAVGLIMIASGVRGQRQQPSLGSLPQ